MADAKSLSTGRGYFFRKHCPRHNSHEKHRNMDVMGRYFKTEPATKTTSTPPAMGSVSVETRLAASTAPDCL